VPNVMGVLRAEIRRLARKETKQELSSMRRQLAQMRRLLAESRRRVNEIEARAKQAARGALRASAAAGGDETDEDGRQIRFSPAWVKKHRTKLGMSRLVYARLVGVSPQTIMGWEAGRTRPRRGALRSWRAIRAKGVRELRSMVPNGSGDLAPAGRSKRGGRPKRGRALRAVLRKRVKRAAGRRRVKRAVARTRVRRTVKRAYVRRAVGPRVRAAKKK
jgi:DNA-binding transcriptional regulator YiaG